MPVSGTSRYPLQRVLKVSAPMEGSGEPVPQSKLIWGSVRVSTGLVKSALSKYAPVMPVPEEPTMMATVAGSEVVSESVVWKVNLSVPVKPAFGV